MGVEGSCQRGGWGRVNKSLIDGMFDKGVGRIRVVGESKKG